MRNDTRISTLSSFKHTVDNKVSIELESRRCLLGDGLPRCFNMMMTTGGQITKRQTVKKKGFIFQTNIRLNFLLQHCTVLFLCICLWRVQKVSIIVCINVNSKTCTSWVECNHIRISIFFLWFILLHLNKFQYQIAVFYYVWSKNALLSYNIGGLNCLDSMHAKM